MAAVWFHPMHPRLELWLKLGASLSRMGIWALSHVPQDAGFTPDLPRAVTWELLGQTPKAHTAQ